MPLLFVKTRIRDNFYLLPFSSSCVRGERAVIFDQGDLLIMPLAAVLAFNLIQPFNFAEPFNSSAPLNAAILAEMQQMHAKLPNGGGYFMGIKADPMECPIGLPIEFCGRPLLTPTRASSYCSGVTYALFLSAVEREVQANRWVLSQGQMEALRLQEPDGGRREDEVKLWGWWNADGPGSLYAMTLVTSMGIRVSPQDAQPGDFLNINWAKGGGHSAVFLGWVTTAEGKPGVEGWGSQSSTNGIGEVVVSEDALSGLVITRLTHPKGILSLDPNFSIKRPRVEYDKPPFAGNR